MHPNVFLRTLWRPERKNIVFVAMSFAPKYKDRYENIIRSAIEDEAFGDVSLRSYRVDNSKSGDSILTEIADGIAHSYLVLADVSVVDTGHSTRRHFRNGNVMYEVGIALASRSPSDVLLVRDDREPFLFDVSTIPHLTIDFGDKDQAIATLREAIADRIKENSLVQDSRVLLMVSQLNDDEYRLLQMFKGLKRNHGVDLRIKSRDQKFISLPDSHGLEGLLKSRLVEVSGTTSDGGLLYKTTEFGYAVAEAASKELKEFEVKE